MTESLQKSAEDPATKRMFFVVISNQQGDGIMLMVDDNGAPVLWESIYEARQAAWLNYAAEAFGYEIFEIGTGEQ